VDAQSVKNTDTAENKGYDAGKKVSGIKRHIAVDTQGLPHAIDARHGKRSEGGYSAVGSDFLPSVSERKKSLRAVKSFESPCAVGREVDVARVTRTSAAI